MSEIKDRCRYELPANKLKTAILFQNGSIGDFLMFIFLAELLQKSGYVDHITIVVPRNVEFLTGLLGAYPYISAIEVSRHGGLGRLLKRLAQARVIVIHPTVGGVPVRWKLLGWCISRLCGAEFVGFQDKGPFCQALYSKTLVYKTDRLYTETIQDIVREFGIPILVHVPDLKIIPDCGPVQAAGLDRRPYIVFHPGASAPTRSFSVRAARQVIDHVLRRDSETHVVLSASDTEGRWIEEIRNGLQKRERIIKAVGCSAQEIAGFIQSAQVFVGTDSGITHLACFLRAPVIVAAHHGTANWLPFYCPTATVLYRLEEESAVHQSREYLDAKRCGRLKPFGAVPVDAVCAALDESLDSQPYSHIRNIVPSRLCI
jgi:ADP-heptose:LPS heptosyltransferase